MNYKEKYEKYKIKYLKLKLNMLNGGIKKTIFDFDNFFKDSDNKYMNEYVFSDDINNEIISIIKDDFQIFYSDYYEYLTGSKSYEILLPLKIHDDLYKIDYFSQYNYLKNSFKSELEKIKEQNIKDIIIKLLEEIKNIIKENEIKTFIEKQIEVYNIKYIRIFCDFFTRYKLKYKKYIHLEDLSDLLIELNNYVYLQEIFLTELSFNEEELTTLYNEDELLKLVKLKKKKFIEKLKIDLYNNEKDNKNKIIQIGLQFINNNETSYHMNTIILSKFINTLGTECIFAQRIEPHRHSSTYCRNSVRKEIRELFDFDNFYYVDYYMKDHSGLQFNECINLDKNIYNDLIINDECPYDYNVLKGLDEFCSSWCAYISSIILLNKDIDTVEMAKYFTLFDINDKTLLEHNTEIFNKIKTEQDIEKNEKFDKFYEYIKKLYTIIDYKYSKGYKYIFVKNIKLYFFMMYFNNFINQQMQKFAKIANFKFLLFKNSLKELHHTP